MVTLSLKETVWSWDATVLMVDLFISSGMSSTPAKASSFYWSIYQGPPGLKASKASRLNSERMKTPSTWWKLQPIGVTLPSTSVLCVTQCLSLQGELNKNFLRHCSLKYSGSQPDLVLERSLIWWKWAEGEAESWGVLGPWWKTRFSMCPLFYSYARADLE